MQKKVFIRTVPRSTATGVSEWVNDASGKKMQKTKIGERANTTLCCMPSRKLGGLATGLHLPWTENGIPKKDANTGLTLTLQDYYEQKYNLPKNYLTNIQTDPRGERPLDEAKRTYFENLIIVLNDGITILDLSDFDDLMRYHVILEHPKVANSEKEWKSHKWPNAEFYIELENESDELKYQKNAIKTKAISELYNNNFTLPLKRQAIVILGISNARTTLTEAQIHNLLFEFIENTTANSGTNIAKFTELVRSIETPKGRIELDARYLLQSCIDYRLVVDKQNTYTWLRSTGPIILGETYKETIDTLTNPKKEALVLELRDELKLKQD